MTTTGPILVTGATGTQGGSVLRALRARGVPVRALTRSPQGAAAEALRSLGAEVVGGDFDHPTSLRAAVNGASGVFSVQDFWAVGEQREIAQGIAVADAALAAGVSHLVFASVAAAQDPTGVKHFESKGHVERHVASIGLPYTFIQPVFFLENLRGPNRRARWIWRFLRRVLRGGIPLQVVAVADIGRVAADAFADPARFAGRAIELASDSVTMQTLERAFADAGLWRGKGVAPPMWFVRWFQAEAASNFSFYTAPGWQVDIEACHREFPGLRRLPDWIAEQTKGAER